MAASPGEGRPLRLLIMTHINANFLPLIKAHYESHPDVELRFLDLAADETLAPLAQGPQRMLEAALGGQDGYLRKVEAALLGAREIAFAAVAATLSIMAIFLPVAFMTGTIGKFFFQFGVTVGVAVMLSLVCALTLTPMLCAFFLNLHEKFPRRP